MTKIHTTGLALLLSLLIHGGSTGMENTTLTIPQIDDHGRTETETATFAMG